MGEKKMIHAMCNHFYILDGKCYIVSPYIMCFACFDLVETDRVWTGYATSAKSYLWKELKCLPQEEINKLYISCVECDATDSVPDELSLDYINEHLRTFQANSRVEIYRVELSDLLKVCKKLNGGNYEKS